MPPFVSMFKLTVFITLVAVFRGGLMVFELML